MKKSHLFVAAALLAPAPALATPYDQCGTIIAGPEQCVIFHPDDGSQNVWTLPVPSAWHVGDHARVRGDFVYCPNICLVPCVTGAIYSVCTTGCRADFDRSGVVAITDVFAFLNSWFAGSLSTDANLSGGLDVDDIFTFINIWFAGC